MDTERASGLTRRETLARAGAAGLAATTLGGGLDALLAGAADAAPRHGSLRDIEHVIFLIQENRSFDHYFGTLRGVRGFADKRGARAFRQRNPQGHTVLPFHLGMQYCMPDITHDWGPQHQSWNHGRMDRFVSVHEQADTPAGAGIETMGYYKRSDLRFYYALADAFTICDGYHCSVIGPTDPNRIMSMSATLDPSGAKGGPLVQTLVATRAAMAGTFRWTTMPERLQHQGVSWKVYMDQTGGGILDNVLTYFAPYNKPGELAQRGLHTSYPHDFISDIHHNRLPSVTWILTNLRATEHPGFSSANAGEVAAAQIVRAVMSNPKVWAKTALFITWDENGGFFDHVAPPVAPPGTKGEYLTVSPLPAAANGIAGPIGLGFRVPMLIVSPFTRGGLVCSDTFDHTSMLRFIETRFGVEVPNLSAWRRHVTGDLTSAFNFAAAPKDGRPRLPAPKAGTVQQCNSPGPVQVPKPSFPRQEPGRRPRPSGIARSHGRGRHHR
ncbi:MAG TPA: alkaline phosphatase family protein [Solirubrobacteraceae bacterium]|nr:alkaline phosphatase family protein [Solirubrobacteraceae bacterium]